MLLSIRFLIGNDTEQLGLLLPDYNTGEQGFWRQVLQRTFLKFAVKCCSIGAPNARSGSTYGELNTPAMCSVLFCKSNETQEGYNGEKGFREVGGDSRIKHSWVLQGCAPSDVSLLLTYRNCSSLLPANPPHVSCCTECITVAAAVKVVGEVHLMQSCALDKHRLGHLLRDLANLIVLLIACISSAPRAVVNCVWCVPLLRLQRDMPSAHSSCADTSASKMLGMSFELSAQPNTTAAIPSLLIAVAEKSRHVPSARASCHVTLSRTLRLLC